MYGAGNKFWKYNENELRYGGYWYNFMYWGEQAITGYQ
jgi:hypothetical protein